MTSQEQPRPGLTGYVLRRIQHRLVYAIYQKRSTVLLATVLVIAAIAFVSVRGASEAWTPTGGVAPIRVDVQALAPQGNTLPLVLTEKNGSRQLVIRDMESAEARAIARFQGIQIQGEQPRAYDLMGDLILQVGARVDHVLMVEAERDQFHARIVVSMGSDTRTVRARPADAVALALKTGAPIFVENAVLDRFGGRAAP
jgi:bifunctional DNase/RNase